MQMIVIRGRADIVVAKNLVKSVWCFASQINQQNDDQLRQQIH
jgi:hypothetical protein